MQSIHVLENKFGSLQTCNVLSDTPLEAQSTKAKQDAFYGLLLSSKLSAKQPLQLPQIQSSGHLQSRDLT